MTRQMRLRLNRSLGRSTLAPSVCLLQQAHQVETDNRSIKSMQTQRGGSTDKQSDGKTLRSIKEQFDLYFLRHTVRHRPERRHRETCKRSDPNGQAPKQTDTKSTCRPTRQHSSKPVTKAYRSTVYTQTHADR